MHTLLFHDPGHFHAALTLRRPNPRVDPTIHVYAPPGPDLEAFLALVRSFNERAEAPTDWRVEVHTDDDPLARLIEERRGGIAIGRNDGKLATIRRLHEAGFHVLADKPWITTPAALAELEAVTAGPPLAIDIMLGPHDTVPLVARRIVATEDVFGHFANGEAGEPAIEMSSLHHLYKMVDGRPLERPPWFYDVRVQGDGMVDIHSHMVGQAQDLIDPERAFDFDTDMVVEQARRWSTPVPLALYRESTGEAAFPEALAELVRDGVLDLACNGEIDYRLCGVSAHQRAEWGQREPAGGGDVVGARFRGTGATVIVTQGPKTGHQAQLHVGPGETGGLEARLGRAIEGWRESFPGLDLSPSELGFQVTIPAALRVDHEAQFPAVLDAFLDLVDSDTWRQPAAARIRARYILLAKAQAMASALV